MVTGDKFRRVVKFHGKEPQSFLVSTSVTSPVDQIEELAMMPSPINLRVEDFFNFIFDFSVDLDRRQWRLNSIQNGAWVGEFELGDMEDRMHRLHRVVESECEGMGTRLHYDCEGSEVLVRELLGGVRRPKVLCFHIDFISYFEIWRSGSSGICGALIALLH